MVNLLAYADDIVLLVPSWRGLQLLLKVVEAAAVDIKCLSIPKRLSV